MSDWLLFRYSKNEAKIVFNGGGLGKRHDCLIKLFLDAYAIAKNKIEGSARVAIFSGDDPPTPDQHISWGCRVISANQIAEACLHCKDYEKVVDECVRVIFEVQSSSSPVTSSQIV